MRIFLLMYLSAQAAARDRPPATGPRKLLVAYVFRQMYAHAHVHTGRRNLIR